MLGSDYHSLRFVLHTREGYLTYNGATKCEKDCNIIVLNLSNLGGIHVNFTEKKTIERFLNQSKASYSPTECTILGFMCPNEGKYRNCFNCPDTEQCSENRKKSDFFHIAKKSLASSLK